MAVTAVLVDPDIAVAGLVVFPYEVVVPHSNATEQLELLLALADAFTVAELVDTLVAAKVETVGAFSCDVVNVWLEP